MTFTKRYTQDDYLYICARIKALERNLLTRERLRAFAVAKTDEEALKVLQDAGWQIQSLTDAEGAIAARREETLTLLYRYAPDRRVIDLFRLKYDYHNAKVCVKAAAQGLEAPELYSGAGTVPPRELETALRDKQPGSVPQELYDAAVAAEDLLARTRDPQQSDMLLDGAQARRMLALAQESGSKFLKTYVQIYIDGCNLRIAVRAARAGKDGTFARRAFIEGGTVAPDRLRQELTPELIHKLFGRGPLSDAADAAAEALGGSESLALLDKCCDDALMEHLKSTRLMPFNEAQVAAYLLAVENELTAVRMLLAGRKAQLPEERLLERLRESYV